MLVNEGIAIVIIEKVGMVEKRSLKRLPKQFIQNQTTIPVNIIFTIYFNNNPLKQVLVAGIY